jgi:hypothetical protein
VPREVRAQTHAEWRNSGRDAPSAGSVNLAKDPTRRWTKLATRRSFLAMGFGTTKARASVLAVRDQRALIDVTIASATSA